MDIYSVPPSSPTLFMGSMHTKHTSQTGSSTGMPTIMPDSDDASSLLPWRWGQHNVAKGKVQTQDYPTLMFGETEHAARVTGVEKSSPSVQAWRGVSTAGEVPRQVLRSSGRPEEKAKHSLMSYSHKRAQHDYPSIGLPCMRLTHGKRSHRSRQSSSKSGLIHHLAFFLATILLDSCIHVEVL